MISAAGALIFNEQGHLLLVEPTYKDFWEIPGGQLEHGETPSRACVREITEELGMTRPLGRLLVVDWAPHPTEGDKILFVFDGGTMTAEEAGAIKLPEDELATYEFLPVDHALARLIPRLSRRVAAAIEARAAGHPLYLEHGMPLLDHGAT